MNSRTLDKGAVINRMSWVDAHPIQMAAATLGRRMRTPRSGGCYLDGQRVTRQRLVKAANDIRAARGEPLIIYPGVGM